MARLYANDNFRYDVVECLRALGHDVQTAQEAGQQGGKDPFIHATATKAGQAVLTFNRRHFVRLHWQVTSHAGSIICTDDAADVLATRIAQALAACPVLDNQLIRVNRPP
jgi:hypothetical protein